MVKKAIILMADKGHDPTETAEAYDEFRKAGIEVSFATENGVKPECDSKMLKGWTQKFLGATGDAIKTHNKMIESNEFKNPLSWQTKEFSLSPFNLVYLPGGHEKGVRQIIESVSIQPLLADYFQLCKQSAQEKNREHCLGAVCHGPMVLCNVKDPQTNKSVLYEAKMTALPATFEGGIYHLTRYILGDYYKTFGHGSENVETSIQKVMKDPKSQWKSSILPTPFFVEDEKLNLVTGRFPPDTRPLAKKMIELIS